MAPQRSAEVCCCAVCALAPHQRRRPAWTSHGSPGCLVLAWCFTDPISTIGTTCSTGDFPPKARHTFCPRCGGQWLAQDNGILTTVTAGLSQPNSACTRGLDRCVYLEFDAHWAGFADHLQNPKRPGSDHGQRYVLTTAHCCLISSIHRMEILGTSSIPQLLCGAAAAPGAVHVHLQRAVDGLLVLHVKQHRQDCTGQAIG